MDTSWPPQEPHTPCNYLLRLFVTGSTPRSVRAIRNVMELCEANLRDRYVLEIVDIYQEPALARNAQVIAAPTLVREQPKPVRRLIGDCSDTKKVLAHFDIAARNG